MLVVARIARGMEARTKSYCFEFALVIVLLKFLLLQVGSCSLLLSFEVALPRCCL